MFRLWIIDDNLSLLNALDLAFHSDFQITTFSSPAACLLTFRERKEGKPDIILTDYEMPGMNGLDMLKEILLDSPGRKAFLMSSALTDDIISRAVQLGVKGWMGKPFDLERMRRMIKG